MQKKIIALAVAGLLSGGAFAQSSVTLYGVASASYDAISVTGDSTPAATAAKISSFSRVSTNSSLIGFKGVEDIGGGLSAIFQFEGGVSFDAGGALAFSRDSFVGLKGGFGTVALGNLTRPSRAMQVSLDVNVGNTGIGTASAMTGKLGNRLVGGFNSAGGAYAAVACGRSTTCTSPFDTRFQNTIAYTSPSFSGLTLSGAYVANENKTADSVAAKLSSKAYDLGAKYENGPLMAALTFSQAKVGNVADTKMSNIRLGGSYNFGDLSIRGLWDNVKLQANAAAEVKQDVWGIGATYNVTPATKLTSQYYAARDVEIGNTSQADTGANLFTLGVEHSLSKRTMLLAVYARLDNDQNSSYDYGINAVGVGFAATGVTLNGVQFGLRHSF